MRLPLESSLTSMRPRVYGAHRKIPQQTPDAPELAHCKIVRLRGSTQVIATPFGLKTR
jgi:hypothetical protein